MAEFVVARRTEINHIHLFGMPEEHNIQIRKYPYANLHCAW